MQCVLFAPDISCLVVSCLQLFQRLRCSQSLHDNHAAHKGKVLRGGMGKGMCEGGGQGFIGYIPWLEKNDDNDNEMMINSATTFKQAESLFFK